MKDENIKEILDNLEKVKDSVGAFIGIDNKGAQLLLDYITNLQTIEREYSAILSENAELENKITNLQEENEAYKEIINIQSCQLEELKKQKTDYTQVNILEMQLNDYKIRNEKAIEYIEKGNKHFKENYNEPYEYAFMVNADEIMKILQGKSDE